MHFLLYSKSKAVSEVKTDEKFYDNNIAKHVKEFKTVENYTNALDNIPNVLANPEFTFYDKEKDSILYYSKLDETVCYVVKINILKDYSYLASLYPVSLKKMQKKNSCVQ